MVHSALSSGNSETKTTTPTTDIMNCRVSGCKRRPWEKVTFTEKGSGLISDKDTDASDKSCSTKTSDYSTKKVHDPLNKSNLNSPQSTKKSTRSIDTEKN